MITPSCREPACLPAVLAVQSLPMGNVQAVAFNQKAVQLEAVIRSGDRFALFPKETPFFTDRFRFRNTQRERT